MGKKSLKLPSLFKTKQAPHKNQHRPFQFLPSCSNSKPLSFRAGDEIFKTVNSVFFNPSSQPTIETQESSWFTTSSSSESASFSTDSEEYCHYDGESLEILVRGVRSERLFFESGSDTNSILEKAKVIGFPFKESVVIAIESDYPYEDFKRSMVEMVESHGVKSWEGLEELLSWYLRVNGKNNHGFIVSAFLDLFISMEASNSSSESTSYSSAVSSFSSSSPLCNEIIELEPEEETVTS